MSRYIVTFVILLIFWMVMSGNYHTPIITMSVISGTIVAFFTSDLLFPGKKINLTLIVKIIFYVPVLLKEIILANLQVLKILLKKDILNEIDPQLVEFPSQVTSEIGITMLANSITLTPGTITVVAKKDKFIVHALTPDFAKRLYGSQFEKKIMEIEKFL